jgi:periplasmic protein TonB
VDTPAAEHGRWKRWAISAALALALHAAAFAEFAIRGNTIEGDDGNSVIEIQLGPVTDQPSETRDDVAPGQKQDLQEETPPAPAPTVPARDEQAKAESEPDGEIALPQPKQDQAPAPEAPASSPATAPPKQRASAAQIASWNRRVAQTIARHKVYPAAARARRETGDVEITFTLESNGTVASSRVIRSSGHAALDQEALDTIRRAAPFPPPPAGVAGKQLEFTLPLSFTIVGAPKR